MQLVHFSSTDPFLVDDGLAEALVGYAWELATYRRNDLVRLPGLDGDGVRIMVTLLLGPSMTLSTRTAPGGAVIGDDGAAADLRRRAARLRVSMLADDEPEDLPTFNRESAA